MKKIFLLLSFLSPILAFAQPCATINSVQPTNVFCNGDTTGQIQVNASATAMPITYSIMPVVGTNQSGLFTGLPAGNYTITATDANNCSVNTLVTVTEPTALIINNVTTTTPTCVPGNDGVICMTASGGVGIVTYNLFTAVPPIANASGCFPNLSTGAYIATATDANGCSVSTTIAVTTPGAPIWSSVIGFNMNSCDPDTIQALALPGTSPNITYSINPAASQFSPGTFIISAGGTYTITATDANGCSAITNFTTTANTPQVTSTQIIQPPCGSNSGSITVNATWTNTTFSYVLTPGNVTNTTGIFSGLGPGTYIVSAQGPSCAAVLDTFVLSSKLNPYPFTVTPNSFTATVPTNGTAPYVYTLNGQVIASPQSGLRCTGTDTFRITDGGNCSFDTVFNFVAGNSFPSITLNKNITDASCALTNDGQIIYAPSSPLTYNWIANSNVLASTSNNISNLIPDTYVVKLTNGSGDCIQDTSVVGAVGTACGNITGKAFLDTLVNCAYDTVDIPLANVSVTLIPGNIQRITNANGEFQFLGLAYGNYTVEVDTNFVLGLYPSCNLLQYDTLSSTNTSATNDFPHESVNPVDLYANTWPTPKLPAAPPRSPWLAQTIYYGYTGIANTPVNVNVYALMDSIQHYDTASLAPTAIIGDTIMWTLNNINPTNSLYFFYQNIQNLPNNTFIPLTVWIEPIGTLVGNNTANDTSSVNLPTAISYDPNDKQVTPQGISTPGYIEKTDSILSYKIRFQNTGNAMAFNIFIEDTISNLLDINSLQVLDASHQYLVEKENNLIRFRFNNVMLPDSNADEPNSHGYIIYTINQDAGNQKGDVINNTAHIYFDFNPAVITNTTVNTIGLPVGVENISRSDKFNVYPNPTRGIVYVQELQGRKIKSISLSDIMGRPIDIQSTRNGNNLIKISMSDLPTGIYLLTLDGETVKVVKE